MKINDMTNLYIGYNEKEDFRILICSFDGKEGAEKIAEEYRIDSDMEGKFEILEFADSNVHFNVSFDCDYVLT